MIGLWTTGPRTSKDWCELGSTSFSSPWSRRGLKEVLLAGCYNQLQNVETLPQKNNLSCSKSLLVTGLWDVILTSLLPPIQSCFSKFWAWPCIATTCCKSTWDTVPYFGFNGLSMILCLWPPLHPFTKLLAIQDQRMNNFEWGEGGGEYFISQTCDEQRFEARQVVFLWECLNIFVTGCLSPSYLYSRSAQLLNRVKRCALFAPKDVVIKNSISFP